MFYVRVYNAVGKGEIARYEQFLLFPQCFQKACTTDTKNKRLFGEKKGVQDVLSPDFLNIEAFEINTTSDLLKQTV